MSIKIDNKLSMEFNDTESQKKLMELYGNCESTHHFFISLWVKLGANHLSVVCPSVSGSYVTVSVGQ